LNETDRRLFLKVVPCGVSNQTNNFDALFGLARAYFRNRKFSRALQLAQGAMKIAPGNRDIQSVMQQLKK
jgi:cytochrome c-type biogenesis protein CcmH/NrfG